MPATITEPTPSVPTAEPLAKEEINLEWAPEHKEPVVEESILDKHPYLTAGFSHFQNLEPMVAKPEPVVEEPIVVPEVEPIITTVVESKPDLDLASPERPGDYLTPPAEPVIEKPKRTRKAKEQKVEDTYNEGTNVSMDFNSEVDKMIEDGDDNGLEGIYKKIVKELGKKNRAKTTHWGPIKSSPTDKQ